MGEATREGQCSRRSLAWRSLRLVGDRTLLGDEARDVQPREGDTARRRERPRRVLDSSEGAQRIERTLAPRFMLRSLLRPRMPSWSAAGETMVGGSAKEELPGATLADIVPWLLGEVEDDRVVGRIRSGCDVDTARHRVKARGGD